MPAWQRLQAWKYLDDYYYGRGKRIRESVPDARSEQDGCRKLRQRIAEIHTDRFIGPAEDKLLFSDLVQLIKTITRQRTSIAGNAPAITSSILSYSSGGDGYRYNGSISSGISNSSDLLKAHNQQRSTGKSAHCKARSKQRRDSAPVRYCHESYLAN